MSGSNRTKCERPQAGYRGRTSTQWAYTFQLFSYVHVLVHFCRVKCRPKWKYAHRQSVPSYERMNRLPSQSCSLKANWRAKTLAPFSKCRDPQDRAFDANLNLPCRCDLFEWRKQNVRPLRLSQPQNRALNRHIRFRTLVESSILQASQLIQRVARPRAHVLSLYYLRRPTNKGHVS